MTKKIIFFTCILYVTGFHLIGYGNNLNTCQKTLALRDGKLVVQTQNNQISTNQQFKDQVTAVEVFKLSKLYLDQFRIDDKPIKDYRELQELIQKINNVEYFETDYSQRVKINGEPISTPEQLQTFIRGITNAIHNLKTAGSFLGYGDQ